MSKKYNFKKNANGETVLHNQGRRRFNVFAPICCLLLAVVIWMYVAGSDPGETVTYTVSLKYRGIDVAEEKWSAEPWMPSETRVKVTLNGPEKFLKKIGDDQIEAFVDLSDATGPGVVTLPVQIDIPGLSSTVEVRSVSVNDVTVLLDSESTRTVGVRVNLPASQNVTAVADPGMLELWGPTSVLDKIDVALVSLYGDLHAGQSFLRQTYIFLDGYGNVITDSFLPCVSADAKAVNVQLTGSEGPAGEGEAPDGQ